MLALAQKIQSRFPRFYLAGETALMLRHQHRISTDLDFFCFQPFSFYRLAQKARRFFLIEREELFEDNLDLFIEGTKVSFIYFPFRNLEPLERLEGIQCASDFDILLNKIYAAGRRVEPKDPLDVAFLYRKYQWEPQRIKQGFEAKFPDQSYEFYLGALLHFEDYPSLSEEDQNTLLQLLI